MDDIQTMYADLCWMQSPGGSTTICMTITVIRWQQ